LEKRALLECIADQELRDEAFAGITGTNVFVIGEK
jgi:hypothetical protein